MVATNKRIILLALLFLNVHCLFAQQTMHTEEFKIDTALVKKVHKSIGALKFTIDTTHVRRDTIAKRDTIEWKDGKKVMTCPRCKGKGKAVEYFASFNIAKKDSCRICNAVHYGRHFYVVCKDCRGKGCFIKFM